MSERIGAEEGRGAGSERIGAAVLVEVQVYSPRGKIGRS